MNRRAAVLGATGFIGGQVVRAAVARDWSVRAIRRRDAFTGAIGDVPVEWAQADLVDVDSLVAAMRGVDVVFHVAARYVHTAHRIQEHVAAARDEIRRVLDAAKRSGASRLIYTSTLTTLGAPLTPGRPVDERSMYTPGSADDAYHELKWAMEQEVLRGGFPAIVLCPTVVFGPGDVHLSISQPLLEIARGRVFFTAGGAINVIDARDAAEAHVVAAERGRIGERYILGGHNLTLAEFSARAAQIAGVAPPRFRIPDPFLNLAGALSRWLPGDPAAVLRSRHLLHPVDNAKAVAELGLSPRSLDDTLRDALAWLRSR